MVASPADLALAIRSSIWASPGAGYGGIGLVGLAQHVEYGAQLAQSFLAGPPDRAQRVNGRPGTLIRDVDRRPGLDVDRGHGVRDHVMQFPRDPQPLLVDPPLGGVLGAGLDGRRRRPGG